MHTNNYVFLMDGYLVFFAFSLALALLILGQRPHLSSVRKNLQWISRLDQISLNAYRIILALSAFFFILWTLAFWAKHYSFNLDFIDSGIYSNIVFNSSQGQWFYSSFHKANAMGEHFSPIMMVFVPFFWIHPSILWLLTAQTAAFAVCPVILFFICREVLKNEKLAGQVALGATVLWFAFPSLTNAVISGIHPSTLSPPFILLGFLTLIRNQMKIFWAIMITLLLFKENLALIWISFGLYSLLVLKRKSLGITLILLGGLWGIAVTKWVIPFFGGADMHQLSRLGPTHFLFLKLKYLIFYLFLPLGFLSLANWRAFLMIWPPIFLNLLVQYTNQFQGKNHYDDVIVPLLFLAAISGIMSIKKWPQVRNLKLLNARFLMCWFIVPLMFALLYPTGLLIKYFPNKTHLVIAQELQSVHHRWPGKKIHMDHKLKSKLNNRENFKSLILNWKGWKFDSGDLVILVPALKENDSNPMFKINDYAGALQFFENNLGSKFKRIDGSFHFLKIYEVL